MSLGLKPLWLTIINAKDKWVGECHAPCHGDTGKRLATQCACCGGRNPLSAALHRQVDLRLCPPRIRPDFQVFRIGVRNRLAPKEPVVSVAPGGDYGSGFMAAGGQIILAA
jgi:hypothetical protein